MPWRHKMPIFAAALLVLLFIPWTSYGQELTIDVLDVGQGDSILIDSPRHHRILIDGGPDDSVIDQLDHVIPFWDRQLDMVMLSHPQADHIGGVPLIIDRFKVGTIAETHAQADIDSYQAIKRDIAQRKVAENKFERGSIINTYDGLIISSLWPPPDSDWTHVDDLNDVAQVCLLQFGYFTALFTADAGANIDERLEGLGGFDHIDFLKVAHHGSKTGMSQSFLEKIHPYASVISVGAQNRYGHPAPSTLRQLAAVGSAVWRTDMDGRVEIKVNGAGFSVYPEKIQYNTAL